MKELRKDYFLDRWVYFSPKRIERPQEFKKKKLKACYFCPGNEKLTPPEIGRVEEKGSWKIRWFPNKFPVVEARSGESSKGFLTSKAGYGRHEVIAETPNHNEQLWDLSVSHIAEIFKVYAIRIKALSKLKETKYVTVFKNHGKYAGTSLIHSHTQVASLPKIPTEVMRKIDAVKKLKKCPHCKVIKTERKSKRKIFENKSCFVVAPYASRFSYEAWIIPKRHVKNITALNDNELNDMAECLKKIIFKLKDIDASYNYYLQYGPAGSELHFHIEVIPRKSTFAGFEYSTDEMVNSVMPEEAAKFYRSK